MTTVLALLVIAAVVVGPWEWRVARRRGWTAGYRAAQDSNRETNAAVHLQLTNYERAEVDRFDATHHA